MIFKKKKPKTQVVGDEWDHYSRTYRDDNHETVAAIRFDFNAAAEKDRSGYDVCCRVSTPVDSKDVHPTGIPNWDAVKRLQEWTDELCDALQNQSVDCHLVGTLLYNGQQELVFQCADDSSFDKVWYRLMGSLTAGSSTEFEPGWEYFDHRVRPDRIGRQQLKDRDLVQDLIDAGMDQSSQHNLLHFFVGESTALKEIREKLRELGFKHVGTKDIKMVLKRKNRLDAAEMSDLTESLILLCDSFDARYDGWGPPLTGRPPQGARPV